MSTSPQPPCPQDASRIEPVPDPLKKQTATANPPSCCSNTSSTSEPRPQTSLTKDKTTSKPRKRKRRNVCTHCKQGFRNAALLEMHCCPNVESESRELTLSERGLAGGAFKKIEQI